MEESKILLVDDDELILSGMGLMLEIEGYKVTTAESGEKAIKQLEKNTFDLVLTDLVMENVDGFAVVKKAKELYPETTTMVLTGSETTDFAIDALRIGCGTRHHRAKKSRRGTRGTYQRPAGCAGQDQNLKRDNSHLCKV